MNVVIVAVGKIKERYLSQGIKEYQKRLNAYGKLEVREVKEESFAEPLSAKEITQILDKEAERINKQIPARSFLIVLDREGEMLSSEELATRLDDLAVRGISSVAFVIGSSFGLAESIKNQADLRLSFSRFTFPHQLMRLILAEQIYRVMTIRRQEAYHK